MNDVYFSRLFTQDQRVLKRRVAASDDHDMLVSHTLAVASTRSEDSATGKIVLSRNAKFPAAEHR